MFQTRRIAFKRQGGLDGYNAGMATGSGFFARPLVGVGEQLGGVRAPACVLAGGHGARGSRAGYLKSENIAK